MSQHDFIVDNADGASVRADINAALQALASLNEGGTEPPIKYPFMLWPDTTTGKLKQRNGANTAWRVICSLDDLRFYFEPAPADQKASGLIATMTYGAAITKGQTLYLDSTEKLQPADSDDPAKMPAMALALEAGGENDAKDVLLLGFYRDETLFNWAAVGGPIYVSGTAGAMTQTKPSPPAQVQVVGLATHADRVWFAPTIPQELNPLRLKYDASNYVDLEADSNGDLQVKPTGDKMAVDGMLDLAEQAADPATPPSGKGTYYCKTDGKPYFKNDGGVETDLTAVADGTVSQAKLKTSTGSVSATADSYYTNAELPGGEYGFYPQIKMSAATSAPWRARLAELETGYSTSWTSYKTAIALKAASSGTIYAQQRYVTSSGEVHWIFVLRDRSTREVLAMWQAPDHPCFGNGGKPGLMPHPFPDYDPEAQEIVVINPTPEEAAEIKSGCMVDDDNLPDRDFLEVLMEDYEIDDSVEPDWPDVPVTVALPPEWEERPIGAEIQPIKKVIPKPDGVRTARLRKVA